MNQIFNDLSQGVHIKILSSSQLLDREMVGAMVFSSFVKTNSPTQLDTKTLLVSTTMGKCADRIPLPLLNEKITSLFKKIKQDFTGPVFDSLCVENLIEELSLCFIGQKEIEKSLDLILAAVAKSKKFPIHGDLQKQNILIDDQENIALIDFEHFCFGPQELELVNSLFHNDSNCLDLVAIVPPFIKQGIVSVDLLEFMFLLYTLKEVAQGTPINTARKNYLRGLGIITQITGEKELLAFPKFSSKNISLNRQSYCFT